MLGLLRRALIGPAPRLYALPLSASAESSNRSPATRLFAACLPAAFLSAAARPDQDADELGLLLPFICCSTVR